MPLFIQHAFLADGCTMESTKGIRGNTKSMTNRASMLANANGVWPALKHDALCLHVCKPYVGD